MIKHSQFNLGFSVTKCFKIIICNFAYFIDPLNVNFTKWSNTFKQFVGNLPTNCLSVFDYFVGGIGA